MKNQKKSKSKDEKKETALVEYKAEDLDIKFPDNKNLTEKEMALTQNAINRGGIAKSDGSTYVDKKSMPALLHTDKKGANKVYNDLDNADKFQDGNSSYASTPALLKEVTKRIEEPRPQLEREQLKYGRDCLNAFTDSPKLETARSVASDRIQKELPKLTAKKMKAENIQADQLTGEPFNGDAEGHHVERKSDNPRKAMDPNNIIVVKKDTHKEIHKNGAEDPEALKKLAQEKHWDMDHI